MRQHRPHATLISARHTKEGNNVCICHQFLLIDSAGYVNQLNSKVPFSTFDEILFTISENGYCHGWLLQLYEERKTGQRGPSRDERLTALDPIVLS